MIYRKQFINIDVFYWSCAAILWTYMSVTIIFNLYKSWYIVAAGVLLLALHLIKKGLLVNYGLYRSSCLILLYYGYLLFTSTWAEFPDSTIWYVVTELINVIIFGLFYLLSLNISSTRMIDFFVYLLPPTAIIYITTYQINHDITRIGGYTLVFLPVILLFCVLKYFHSPSKKIYFYVLACIMMLISSMSRTPILISGLGLFIIFITIAKQIRSQRLMLRMLILTCFFSTIAYIIFQPMRENLTKTIVRITSQDMYIDDKVYEAELPDEIRWTINDDAFSLYPSNWLLGMGYMNFQPWFGNKYNFSFGSSSGKEIVGMNLHDSFQSWALEGGVPCLVIVFLIIKKYFSILSIRIRQCNNILEITYFKILFILMVCVLVDGLFHQIHQQPVFFILLGIVFALNNKVDGNAKTYLPITN